MARAKTVDEYRIPTEEQDQIKLATWLDKNNILFYHVPNGGSRHAWEAVKFKRMGTKRGVPDICVPISNKGYHGLYIELKRVSGGVLSTEQCDWLNKLKDNGYLAKVCNGFLCAKLAVEEYFE